MVPRPIVLLLIFPLLGLGLKRDTSYYNNRWSSSENEPFGSSLKSSVKFISSFSDQIFPGNSDKHFPSAVIPDIRNINLSSVLPGNRVQDGGHLDKTRNKTAKINENFAVGKLSKTNFSSSPAAADDRDKRFFFTQIQDIFSKFIYVKNISCVSTSGDNGTCYKSTDCTTLGGSGSGTCGAGNLGVCCVFTISCGGSSMQNVTYFTSQGYPNSFDATGSCQAYISKVNTNICQLRLDFIDFTINGPNSTSTVCTNDRFTVSGGQPIPTICGSNAGNHMYIDLGPGVTTPTTLSFITMGASFQRKWKVKVTQIPCNADYAAPDGCLQYFTGITGAIQTYNFGFDSGGQLANQDYTTCIRTERNFCGIMYTPCVDSTAASATTGSTNPRSFTLSGIGNVGSITGTSTTTSAATACGTDWVVIPCAASSSTPTNTNCFDRFCGTLLNIASQGLSTAGNAAAYSFIKPFTLTYHTDGSEVTGEVNNRGYCLNYVEQPCT